jgi:PBSX family phage terminase large subunit
MIKTIFEPSQKAKLVWRNRGKARIRLLEGAVRSSKSFTANDLAIEEIQALPPCNVLLSGFSITSVARNVLAEWKKAINPPKKNLFTMVREDKDEYLKINWRGLKNKKFYLRGAGKENDYMQIQGATFGYWLCDEVTRHCESFVDMALSRLSMDGAQATWTTNPDHPLHFVKTRFIDDKKLYEINADTGRAEIICFTFYLSDNPSLTPEYVRGLGKLYTGVFHQRYIESKWVMAEGAIYDFFTTGTHTAAGPLANVTNRYIGIDYGTHNPTVYLMFGRIRDGHRDHIRAEREYYYNSVAGGHQKDDAEYAKDFVNFLGHTEVDAVIYDPSALSLILAIKKALAEAGRALVFRAADNSVLDGIRTQQRLLVSGEYTVCENCTQTILDYGSYVWDKRAAARGEDAPLKEYDHTKDAERYVLHTLYGGNFIDYEQALK